MFCLVPEETVGLGEGAPDEVVELVVCPGFDTEVVANVGLALPDPSDVLLSNLEVMGSYNTQKGTRFLDRKTIN